MQEQLNISPSGKRLRGGGYSAIHKWLQFNFGKASICENSECKRISKRFHWAKKPGKEYEHIRDNFFQLCASCHKTLDYTDEAKEKLRSRLLGTKLPLEHVLAIRKGCKGINKGNKHTAKKVEQRNKNGELIKIWGSLEEAANFNGVSASTISRRCNGKIKTSNNFIWSYLHN